MFSPLFWGLHKSPGSGFYKAENTRIRAFSLPSNFPSAGHCPDLSVLAEYGRHELSEMEIQSETEEGRVGEGIQRERTHIMI